MKKTISDFCPLYNDFIVWQKNKLIEAERKTPIWKRIVFSVLRIKKKKYRVVIPMTMNQARFANFLLENAEDISSIGNMEAVFVEVRKFIRQNG